MYNFSLTQIGSKMKKQMAEPIESVIMRGQQKVEIDDDRILNILKKQKNVYYKLTPFGTVFLASITNDTKQIFVTCRELNDAKKIANKR